MGSQIKARCTCGLERTILIGGGMFTFESIEYFPCLCEDCKDVVQGNLKDEKLNCPSCNSLKVSPYNDKALIGKLGNKVIAQSFKNELHDGTYKCPKCDKMSLHFIKGFLHFD
jgi:Zn finger protein HypA/HybF involved in hydrogenase expression